MDGPLARAIQLAVADVAEVLPPHIRAFAGAVRRPSQTPAMAQRELDLVCVQPGEVVVRKHNRWNSAVPRNLTQKHEPA